mgnify:FL=1
MTIFSSIDILQWSELSDLNQKQLKELLLNADPDWQHVLNYLPDVSLFIMFNRQQDMIAELCLLQCNHDEFEIKNLSVRQDHQGLGLAKLLISYAIESVKKSFGSKVWVKTGNSSLNQLALYQKCGFRMSHIQRDAFKSYPEPIYEQGIRCIDQVVLSIQLDVMDTSS